MRGSSRLQEYRFEFLKHLAEATMAHIQLIQSPSGLISSWMVMIELVTACDEQWHAGPTA
ncbi:MAG: hypothetical protein C4346_15460 [Chloroflexota bacterium]